ncbi:MAG: hypothetical protein KF751_04960 [Nitrospira sp.]|nr:hypothetical protein [Nitrospira sp.]
MRPLTPDMNRVERSLSLFAQLVLVGCVLATVGCSNIPAVDRPIVRQADDRHPIPEPQEEVEGQWALWDGTDKMIFYRIGQLFNLGRSFRTVGTWIGLADPMEAQNIDAFDEVPDSTWFTNRHELTRLSSNELTDGPATENGAPDMTGPWTAVSAKESLGSTPGFVIRDAKGDIYLLKFDPLLHPEMTTASEVISSRFLHAAGYHVPQHYLVDVDPKRIMVGPKAKFRGRYHVPRPMTDDDLAAIMERVPHRPDGTIRAMASKFLPGIPKGPFLYTGQRPDDPNDRIRHENRRELRGLRVIAAFLNHTDTKAANALDMYDPKEQYLKHYLIDFSSTLGADNADPQLTRFGNEYFLDFGTIGRSLIEGGFYVKPWEVPIKMGYPAVGYFESEYFDPERWRPTYPNPAFLQATARDGYWGAKIVVSFTDEDIDTIVHTGGVTDPRAERYVADVLKARRDKIGRYYFALLNPLERFTVHETTSGGQALTFGNLALAHDYAPAKTATYRYTVRRYPVSRFDPELIPAQIVAVPHIPLSHTLAELLRSGIASHDTAATDGPVVAVEIQTSYNGVRWSPKTTAYLRLDAKTGRFHLIGLDRET